MINYSFFSKSKNTKEEALKLLQDTNKKILYTYGLKFRQPTTYEKPIKNSEALKLFLDNPLNDVVEYENYIDFNQYSSNDLY